MNVNRNTLKSFIVNMYKNPYQSLGNDLVVQSISSPSPQQSFVDYTAVLSEVDGSFVFKGQATISFKQYLT
jgi:hypothetical protein